MLSLNDLASQFASVIEDSIITDKEKYDLRKMVKNLDIERLNYLRNRAFEMSREQILTASDNDKKVAVLNWLERFIKIIDSAKNKMTKKSSVHFSPGEECRAKLIELCRGAKKTIEICVYTISDNRLSEAIIDAHERGVRVRVITDNAKSDDLGSDIDYLVEKNIPLVMDVSKYHMHHKFAVFDNEWLANGSFNWTRSASEKNEENILVLNDTLLIHKFSEKFNVLWKEYSF